MRTSGLGLYILINNMVKAIETNPSFGSSCLNPTSLEGGGSSYPEAQDDSRWGQGVGGCGSWDQKTLPQGARAESHGGVDRTEDTAVVWC